MAVPDKCGSARVTILFDKNANLVYTSSGNQARLQKLKIPQFTLENRL